MHIHLQYINDKALYIVESEEPAYHYKNNFEYLFPGFTYGYTEITFTIFYKIGLILPCNLLSSLSHTSGTFLIMEVHIDQFHFHSCSIYDWRDVS